MTLIPLLLLFLVGSMHCACFKDMEHKNKTWKWNDTLGSKHTEIKSAEDCLNLCVDDYECMAFTFKVSISYASIRYL